MNDFKLPDDFNVFASNLEELSAEQLLEVADQFVIRIVVALYGPENLRLLAEAGEARTVAVNACIRFIEVMNMVCERTIELKTVKDYLNSLLDHTPGGR